MLKRQFRLKKKYQFNYCYKAGKTVGSKNMILYYVKSYNKNIKIGLSVSKKVGHAVTRNKIKRRLREAITIFADDLQKNYNIIVVARPSIVNSSFSSITTELKNMLNKANLFV